LSGRRPLRGTSRALREGRGECTPVTYFTVKLVLQLGPKVLGMGAGAIAVEMHADRAAPGAAKHHAEGRVHPLPRAVSGPWFPRPSSRAARACRARPHERCACPHGHLLASVPALTVLALGGQCRGRVPRKRHGSIDRRIISTLAPDVVFGLSDVDIWVASPDARNQCSLRAFEKAGFERRQTLTVP